jgi:hypothetical protein
MRLGKEQAVGYVEDTDSLEETVEDTAAGALPAQEPATARSDGMPLTPAAERSPVG